MYEALICKNLKKTFTLSAKQRKIRKSNDKYLVAVDDLSFSVFDGEIYGLLGPNGAGKTTTLRMISTLIKPDSGDVKLDGVSIIDNPDKVREMIGFLTSELKLEDFFTPSYLYDYFSALYGVDKEIAKRRKAELFKKFGIDKFMEVKVGDLSTGMKQKVSLVISLVHDPKFVIFDEPTNGLDVLTAKTVEDFLFELKKMGKTIIISTHIFSLAEKMCDRIGIIFDGHMVCSDTIINLTKDMSLEDKFFSLYKGSGHDE